MGDADGALIAAIHGRDWPRVVTALAAGADPNAQDDAGYPALTLLCKHPTNGQWLAALDALLAAGADAAYRDRHGYTAEMMFDEEHPETLPDPPAVASPALAAVDALLARLAAADPAPPRVEVLRRLRAAGADGTGLPEVALQLAAERGDLDAARAALAAGARGAFLSWRGNTALLAAVRRRDVRLVELLLQAGADVEAGTTTPLQSAAGDGEVEIVRLLLAAGADPLRGRPGRRPVELAARHPAVVALLGVSPQIARALARVPAAPNLDGDLIAIAVEAALPPVLEALATWRPGGVSSRPIEVDQEITVPGRSLLAWQPTGGAWTAVLPLSSDAVTHFDRGLAEALSRVGRALAFDSSDIVGAVGYELLHHGETIEILLRAEGSSPRGLVDRATLVACGGDDGFWSASGAVVSDEGGTEAFVAARFAAHGLWLPAFSLGSGRRAGRRTAPLRGMLPLQIAAAAVVRLT